jgi:hypothetical protein
MTLEANAYTFTTAANMIASQVTPKETHRSVSGLERESGDKIKTEFLSGSKWRALSPDQQAAIRAAREKDPRIKKKSQKQKSVSNRKDRKIKNLQKKISALKRKAGDDNASDDDDADASAGASAGNAFGGREEKKQAKKKTKN